MTNQKPPAWSILIIVIIVFFCSLSAYSKVIRIGGTGSALGTMILLADAYQRDNPQIEITVLSSIGSSGGIKALSKGSIDIGLSARPLKKAELNKGIIAIEYARTPTVIAVSNSTEIYDITISQLVDIYTGTVQRWPDGSLIRPVLRQPNDVNTRQIKSLSSELKKSLEVAEKNKGFLFEFTDQEAVNRIEKTPGSFGVTSLALILSEKRNTHALTIDGIEPSIESSMAGSYPMTQRFYFILPMKRSMEVDSFIQFVSSIDGVAILKENGNFKVQ